MSDIWTPENQAELDAAVYVDGWKGKHGVILTPDAEEEMVQTIKRGLVSAVLGPVSTFV